MDSIGEHKTLEKQFESFFLTHEYKKLMPVDISSRIDKTVYLINSATNLFKPFLSDKNVCVFAIQRSMRTQILNDYYQAASETEYPTCFESYGAYASIEHMEKLVHNTIQFFTSIGLEISKMRIRASYDDPILINAISSSALKRSLVMDERTEKYDHVYGANLTGRAVKLDYYQDWQKKYKNLCYLILIYEDGIPRGVELATSDQLILMRMHNLKYAISVAKITALLPVQTFEQRRFADSIVGASNMIYEGIRPNSSNTNGRTLKKYLHAITYFGDILQIPLKKIIELICAYIHLEYGSVVDEKVLHTFLLTN